MHRDAAEILGVDAGQRCCCCSAAWPMRSASKATAPAPAARTEAEVAVRNQADAERNAGFSRALAAVLGKVTGDRGAAQRPGVRDELGKGQVVAGYDYRQDEGVAADGAPSFQTTLVVLQARRRGPADPDAGPPPNCTAAADRSQYCGWPSTTAAATDVNLAQVNAAR